MNRGRRKHIYTLKLFEDDTPENTVTTVTVTRGRDSLKVQDRNRKLVHRYYYYAKLKRLQYEFLLDELSKEFDLCKKTISNVLFVENYGLVSEVMNQKLTNRDLRKLYPYFNWQ